MFLQPDLFDTAEPTQSGVAAKTSEAFHMACAPEKFDELKAAFDSIIASYRLTK